MLVKLLQILTSQNHQFLIIYQFWQHTEHEKQAGIARDFSNVFREIRALKSRVEANVHRYTLLMFMIIIEGIGAFITFVTLSTIQWYR